MEQRIVEFRCERCKLVTPAVSSFDEALDDQRKATVTCNCFHCGSLLTMKTKIGKLRRMKKPKEQG